MPRTRKRSAKRRAVSPTANKKHKARAQKRKKKFDGLAAFVWTNGGNPFKPRMTKI